MGKEVSRVGSGWHGTEVSGPAHSGGGPVSFSHHCRHDPGHSDLRFLNEERPQPYSETYPRRPNACPAVTFLIGSPSKTKTKLATCLPPLTTWPSNWSSNARKSSATNEKAGFITRVEELAYEPKIEEVMTRNPETVNPRVQMKELLELLKLSAVIITEGAMPDPDKSHRHHRPQHHRQR